MSFASGIPKGQCCKPSRKLHSTPRPPSVALRSAVGRVSRQPKLRRSIPVRISARHSPIRNRADRPWSTDSPRPATGTAAVALAIGWLIVCPPAATLISSTPRRAASSARRAARATACRSTARRPTGASPNPSRACPTRRIGARLCGGTRWLGSTKCSRARAHRQPSPTCRSVLGITNKPH